MTKDEIRERLVEMILSIPPFAIIPARACGKATTQNSTLWANHVAKYLIEHGVTFAETDGCGYCDVAKAYNDFPLINKNAEVDKWTMMGKKLKYCPMCGRQLPEQPKGVE